MQPYLMPLLAAAISFVVVLALGRPAIAWLRSRACEPIKTDSATLHELHQGKSRTPSMGGLFLLAGLLTAIVAIGDWQDGRIGAAVLLIVGLGLVGLIDDLLKTRGTQKGLSPRAKLIGQVAVAALVCVPLSETMDLRLVFVPWLMIVLMASANAVNLADGLDGLATGMAAIAAAAWLIVACLMRPAAGGVSASILAAATLGAALGFLWFNRHPARIFMGDTGSLPLGGVLGLIAILLGQELLWLMIGGVFVVEAASVVLQVAWYKRTGRRIFRCAPLHHHYQFAGWPEVTVVRRFWLAAVLCAALALMGWML